MKSRQHQGDESASRADQFTTSLVVLLVLLIATLLTGCGLRVPVAGDAEASTSASDPDLNAEQQSLASSIEQLRRERDALQNPEPTPPPKPVTTSSKARSTAPAQAPSQGAPATALANSFSALSRRLRGQIGLAYAPVGLGQHAKTFGGLRTEVGWSTMKVPVAIATVKQAKAHPSQDTSRLMRLTITQSDNDAAMALWSRLGSPTAAAAKTQAVLREGGDTTTIVPSAQLRPGYTPFGQSIWPLAAQATFAASLPCMANTGPVLELMGQVVPKQRWGIGALTTTLAFKGGWGPGRDGAYLVRQMAVLRLSDGSRIGLALAARPADGSFATGKANLHALARWVAENIHTSGANRC